MRAICPTVTAITAPTLSKYGSLRTARSAATARSGRSSASKTKARGRTSSSSSSSAMRFTGSSHRSSVRTVAPSCRNVVAAPSSRSSMGPCPTTATKLFGRLRALSRDFGATNGDSPDLEGWTADADWNALSIFATGPDSIGERHVLSEHGYLSQCFGTVADKVHVFQRRRDLAAFYQVALR